MKGGYISCNGNTWHPTNPGIYNVKEANGLNYLGICFDGNGTNRYNLNGPRKWYFRNNKTNLYKLGEIVEELQNNALNSAELNKNLRNGIKELSAAYTMREQKSFNYEKIEGRTAATLGHINYYNDLNDFISILDNIINYINQRKEIVEKYRRRIDKNPTRKKTRSRSNERRKRKTRSNERRNNRSSSSSRNRRTRSRSNGRR